jgi:hypothetical protein
MLLAIPDPPTVPKIEWPVVTPAEKSSAKPAIPPLELSRSGRHGVNLGDAAIPAASLINHGTYVGKAVHARRDEKQVGNQAGNTGGK